MKYLVMECHEGYAVLMDEESRFVNAANMHYEVGQVVTDPVLMDTDKHSPSVSRRFIVRTIAAAACFAIVSLAGMHFFMKAPEEPHTVVFVSAAADIRMELDSKGSVVSITSDTEEGKEIIRKFKENHKVDDNRVDLASDILEFQIENGYISSGDTVEVLLPADSKKYDTYKQEFETEIAKHDLNPEVKEIKGEPPHEPPKPPVPAATAPAPESAKPHTHADEKHEEVRATTAVPVPAAPDAKKPAEAPVDTPKPPEQNPPAPEPPSAKPADGNVTEKPAPAAPPAGQNAEPPKPAEPGKGQTAPDKAEPPAAPHENGRTAHEPPPAGHNVQRHDKNEISKSH